MSQIKIWHRSSLQAVKSGSSNEYYSLIKYYSIIKVGVRKDDSLMYDHAATFVDGVRSNYLAHISTGIVDDDVVLFTLFDMHFLSLKAYQYGKNTVSK